MNDPKLKITKYNQLVIYNPNYTYFELVWPVGHIIHTVSYQGRVMEFVPRFLAEKFSFFESFSIPKFFYFSLVHFF